MDSRGKGAIGVALVAAILCIVAVAQAWPDGLTSTQESSPPGSTPLAEASFTFAAVGDLAGPSNSHMVALSKRVAATGASFLLAMGDLGYTTDEPGWCSSIKSGINDVLLIAGNHDTGESSGGDIAEFVRYCPFTLGVPVTAGPGTPGYGYEYYFDFPGDAPLMRFIMTTAGVRGSTNYDYSPGSPHFNFVVDAVNDARARGINWVMVGGHKPCINAHSYGCEFTQGLFDKMVELKVDLLLFAHTHTYQRSHQLGLSDACPTVPSNGRFDADCIVDQGHDDHYEQGPGSIVVINGLGGASMYNIGFGTDAELGYMAHVMGGNGNSKGLLAGYGAVAFTVSASGIHEVTDFCPPGTTDGAGQCATQQGSVFHDSFTIGAGTPPPPPPSRVPTSLSLNTYRNPSQVNESVTVSGTLRDVNGTGLANQIVALEWSWDSLTWSPEEQIGAFPPTDAGGRFSATMQFRGTYDHYEYVRARYAGDTTYGSSTSPVLRQDIRVSAPPPPPSDTVAPLTTSSVSGAAGSNGWYQSAVGVTLTATDDQSGVASIHVRVNDGAWQLYTDLLSIPTDGTHAVEYYSTDNSGNVEPVRGITVRIDTVPPITSAAFVGAQGLDGSYVGSVNVTLSSTDASSGAGTIRYRIDEGAWWTYTGPFTLSGDGIRSVEYTTRDVAGNDEAAKTAVVRITGSAGVSPTTTAEVSGTLGLNGWYITPVDVALIATSPSGAATTIAYTIGGLVWKTYTDPFTVPEGRHTVLWQAVDADGHFGPTTSTAMNVDLTDPYVLDLSPDGPVTGPEIVVDWTGFDLASGIMEYEIRVDGGSFESIGMTRTIARTWTAGPHHVEVRATDHAGRESPAVATDFEVLSGDVSSPVSFETLPLYFPAMGLGLLAASFLLIRHRRRKRDDELLRQSRQDPQLDDDDPARAALWEEL